MAQGQRFEWAEGYDSGYDDAFIKGSVTDSLGNLYILGQIHWDSDWDTIWLMPHLTTVNTMVMVAKISPEGEMVWRKIYGSTSTSTFANDIKALGDTGFAVMLFSTTGSPRDDYFYWGDSVYRNVYHPRISPYDTPGRRFSDGFIEVYMAFDFDGNITEEHVIERSLVDTDGNDVVYRPYRNQDSLPWLRLDHLLAPSFDVDVDGNVYICFTQNFAPQNIPTSSEYNGTIGAMRYWVDHRLVGESAFDSNTMTWYPILLKFSPHFDTMIASRYVVQRSTNNEGNNVWKYLKYFKATNKLITRYHVATNNVFDYRDTWTIDTSQELKSFFVVYDSLLNPMNIIEFKDSILDSNDHRLTTSMLDMAIDQDSGFYFFNGTIGSKNTILMYNSTTIPISNGSFVIAIKCSDLSLHSYMEFPSTGGSFFDVNSTGDLFVSNNRVFLQAAYKKGIRLPYGSYSVQGSSNSGLAFVIWDYQGNLIDGKRYNTYSRNHFPGSISLVDSTLYLINFLASNATFGSNQVYVSGYKACVAKYVDTAFMSVYRPPLGGIAPGDSGPEYSFYPNPVENMLQVDLDGDRILQATAVSVLGVRERLGFAGNTVDVSHLRPGLYVLEIQTAEGLYSVKVVKR